MTKQLNPQPGDIVHVRVKVVALSPNNSTGVHIQMIDMEHPRIWLNKSEILAIEPRPLKVGDKVKIDAVSSGIVGTVLAIDGEEAWVKLLVTDENVTIKLSSLTRIEDPES